MSTSENNRGRHENGKPAANSRDAAWNSVSPTNRGWRESGRPADSRPGPQAGNRQPGNQAR
ncbi:MAG TPA: hypothetical protein VF189_02515 [Patescibacteria group bacterium]